MNKGRFLYILSIVVVTLGILFLIAAILTRGPISEVFVAISSLLGVASFVLLLMKLSYDTNAFKGGMENNGGPKVVVKVVDVKDVPKSREQELYEQYEGLYKQKLITKEELAAKRKELLGK